MDGVDFWSVVGPAVLALAFLAGFFGLGPVATAWVIYLFILATSVRRNIANGDGIFGPLPEPPPKQRTPD